MIGAVVGTPGANYVIALHTLVTGKSSAAVQAVAVVVFALIEFSLVIIPFVFLIVRPASTEAQLQHAQHWLKSHARQVLAAVMLIVGAYMVISGLTRLCWAALLATTSPTPGGDPAVAAGHLCRSRSRALMAHVIRDIRTTPELPARSCRPSALSRR